MSNHHYQDYQPSYDDDERMSTQDDDEENNNSKQGGGSGFLFGNIDRKGRLDEDYLSDEAKDNLDNIGTQVTEKNKELNEIREALPGDKNSTEPTYASPEQPQESPSKEDVYEESDGELEIDEDEQAEYANVALNARAPALASKLDDDDEDYDDMDEDGDNDDSAKAQKSLQQPTQAVLPSTTTTPPKTLATPPPSETAKPISTSKLGFKPALITIVPSPSIPLKTDKSSLHIKEDVSLLQQRLFDAAKDQISPTAPDPKLSSHDKPNTDGLILFSELFARTPRPLNFSRPPRHIYGVKPADAELPPPCSDDSDRLLRPKSPVEVDPISQALDKDSKNRELLYPSEPEIRPRVVNIEPCPEFKEASAPLENPVDVDEQDEATNSEIEAEREPQNTEMNDVEIAPFQLMSWENDIVWKDSDDADDDDSNWFTDELAASKKHAMLSSSVVKQSKISNEDSDEEAFDDPVEFNHPIPSQPPATEAKDDDDDDDIWEDGSLPFSSSMETNEKASTQASISNVGSNHTSQDHIQSQKNNDGRAKSKSSNSKVNLSNSEGPKDTTPTNDDKEKSQEHRLILMTDPAARPKLFEEGQELIQRVIEPNKDLASGMWINGIVWNSDSESDPYNDGECDSDCSLSRQTRHQLSRLILDMNDPNMVFEHLTEQPVDVPIPYERDEPIQDISMNKDHLRSLVSISGTQLYQNLQADRFNISNDVYYATGMAQHLKLDRGPTVRRRQDAPPALKIQTAPDCLSDAELLSYRRPKLLAAKLPKNMTLHPLRRKKLKGQALITGQIPKRKVELRCSEKDAYRISLFEYAIERQPCLLPIPGMVTQMITYARKETAEEVQRAYQAAAGTPKSDIFYLAPYDPPPLACGNIEAGDKPLAVVESQLFSAPCAKHDVATTDFLLVRHGKSMYVREIDSLVSIGLTEPKVDVMIPNTERYKKYGRERVYLWVMREFQRMRKEIDKKKKSKGSDDESKIRNPPYLEKEEVFNKFPRRRTYPETSLNRALKDFGKFQNGKYNQNEDIIPQYGNKEQEVMRVLTPTETAAFESMESGWTHLFDRGIYHFTHPSGQGNILAAAEFERSGLVHGPAVGKYIKSLLLKSPWYRSIHILQAHRSQRKDLTQALALARIVNDLKEGGEVMEAKLQTITPTDLTNVLTSVFKYNSKKIPVSLEERRSLIGELFQKKGKGVSSSEVSDYATVIRTVMKKNRDAGLSKGASIAAAGTSMAGGTFLGIPLADQRVALEDGDVSKMPAEEDDFVPDENAEQYIADYENKMKQQQQDETSQILTAKKGRPLISNSSSKGLQSDVLGNSDSKGGSVLDLTKTLPGSSRLGSVGGGNADRDKPGLSSPLSSTILGNSLTDPSASGVKISIDMKKLEKAGFKKKSGGAASDKPKSKTKSAGDGKDDSSNRDLDSAGKSGKKTAEKKAMQQIGKIKINAKQLHKDKEQAALKRKRSQYSEDFDYRAKKAPKTSRKKRNGTVELNGILEQIENTVRTTEGYVDPSVTSKIRIERLRSGESPPVNVPAENLANPSGTGLDFIAPVDTKLVPAYKDIVKKPMYLNLIRTNCKQMKYKNSSEFLKDMELILTNAKAFNKEPGVQWVVQHAELLYDVAKEQVSRLSDEIKMAEDMVAMEEIEAKGSGVSAGTSKKKSKSKNSKGSGGGAGPSSDKKKKKPVKDNITIPDGDDEVMEVPPTSNNFFPQSAGDNAMSDLVVNVDD